VGRVLLRHEGGNSQYEFDFGYSDALTQSDRFTFFRLMVKEVAKKLGAFATFMPKPYSDSFGSGAHYNMSLFDPSTGDNLFADDSDPRGMGYSKLAYHFVAGMLKHAGAITAVTCPKVNSCKRLVGRGFMDDITWAPVFVRYGDNNRTLMIRLPDNRWCVENRACDISSNMYPGARAVTRRRARGDPRRARSRRADQHQPLRVRSPQAQRRGRRAVAPQPARGG
jgi:glutamine synthetase